VLGLYGSEDAGNPAESVHAMEAALNDAGVKNTIVIYDGAAHAFFNDTRASYDPEAAADAWQRTLAWFDENLKTS
jgi:carboxymethylenebutenolidase